MLVCQSSQDRFDDLFPQDQLGAQHAQLRGATFITPPPGQPSAAMTFFPIDPKTVEPLVPDSSHPTPDLPATAPGPPP